MQPCFACFVQTLISTSSSSVDVQLQFTPTKYGHCLAIRREEAIEDISGLLQLCRKLLLAYLGCSFLASALLALVTAPVMAP